MNIQPLADRVLIKPTPAEEKTLSGIIIPDSAKRNPCAAQSSLQEKALKMKKWWLRKMML